MTDTETISPANKEVAEEGVLINARQLRQMIPVHDNTIRRWENDPKIAFPKRIRLCNGHNFWRLTDVKLWQDRREKSQADTVKPDSSQKATEA